MESDFKMDIVFFEASCDLKYPTCGEYEGKPFEWFGVSRLLRNLYELVEPPPSPFLRSKRFRFFFWAILRDPKFWDHTKDIPSSSFRPNIFKYPFFILRKTCGVFVVYVVRCRFFFSAFQQGTFADLNPPIGRAEIRENWDPSDST